MTTQRTWGGRFTGSMAEAMLKLSESVSTDRVLADDDIDGSMAHARALEHAGVLTRAELDAILGGLESVRGEIRNGTFAWEPKHEDVT